MTTVANMVLTSCLSSPHSHWRVLFYTPRSNPMTLNVCATRLGLGLSYQLTSASTKSKRFLIASSYCLKFALQDLDVNKNYLPL